MSREVERSVAQGDEAQFHARTGKRVLLFIEKLFGGQGMIEENKKPREFKPGPKRDRLFSGSGRVTA